MPSAHFSRPAGMSFVSGKKKTAGDTGKWWEAMKGVNRVMAQMNLPIANHCR
uniref:Uncharacterized protein n=1 Tax=Vitis vinifera TaxID=29760 RepID=F6HXY4_VITVI